MANRLPVSNQRLPEILNGWHLPGGSQLESNSPKQTQGAEAGTAEGRRRTAPRESALVSLLAAWAARVGKAQNAGPTESASLWSTQEPESEWLRPGKCTQLRAHSLESSQEPEQYRRGKHTPYAGANPVWPEHCECSPHMPVTFVCSTPPSLPTARLNKWT